MKTRRVLLFSCFFSLLTAVLYSQENLPPQEDSLLSEEQGINEDEEITLPPYSRRIEMELKTSTLPELAALSRSLGLSESGTREELARRIRQYYEIPEPDAAAKENTRIITIESAQTIEYFRIDVIDEDYARLKGDVSLSLIDNDATHSIRAHQILFNRTRNIITAEGSVTYERKTAAETETFRGETITVNLDDWSSVFLDGQSTRTSDGTSYLFSGTVISRTNEDVTVLNKATITSATSEETYWSLTASRVWLLPGSDFAFLNAVLKIGEIPVLWLPFFFYPMDEVVFHPVIGYRSREGGFIQTTTYILGRPKAEQAEANSLTRIFGNTEDTEKELHGLFLRSTGQKVVDQSEVSLKAIFDYYVNLGFYLGMDLSLPKSKILEPVTFSLGMGFSRTISLLPTGNYSPYYPDNDGSFDWNHSNFISFSVPFRYRMQFASSISGQQGSISWSFPYYSDPFVESDFLNRSETMDWINMLRQGANAPETTTTTSEIRSYQWQIIGNYTPKLPEKITPYLSRITFSNISTTFSFRTREDASKGNFSPERAFYAPDKYTILSFSGSILGSPLSLGDQTRPSARTAVQADDPLNGLGMPISPWADEESGIQASAGSPAGLPAGSSAEQSAVQRNTAGIHSAGSSYDETLTPPVLSQRFNLPSTGNIRYNIDYQIFPTSTTELQFMTDKWNTLDEVDWSARSILTNISIGNSSNISFRMAHSTGLFSNTVTFSGGATWRDYLYLNEDLTPAEKERLQKQQYSQTNYSTAYTYNGTLRPLYRNEIFGQSNLQYTFRGTLVRSKRYAGGDGPELTPQWGSWVKEGPDTPGLTSHQISSNIAANVFDKQQILSMSVNLPPLDTIITTNATFRFWISDTNINFRIRQLSDTINPANDGRWVFDPINITETLTFAKIGSFRYFMVMDPEENFEVTTITSSLFLWNFRSSFSAGKAYRQKFDEIERRWERVGNEQVLQPKELSFGFNRKFAEVDIIPGRLNFSFDLNTSLTFDLIQHTSSNFDFRLIFTFKIVDFLDITFTAISDNHVIFRYFKAFKSMDHLTFMYPSGPQNNLFIDLFYSFNFWDESKRRLSGFKMRSFELKATHYLGDWTAELGVSMKPYKYDMPGGAYYKIGTDISFLMQWKPISEFKTDLRYKGEDNRWSKH